MKALGSADDEAKGAAVSALFAESQRRVGSKKVKDRRSRTLSNFDSNSFDYLLDDLNPFLTVSTLDYRFILQENAPKSHLSPSASQMTPVSPQEQNYFLGNDQSNKGTREPPFKQPLASTQSEVFGISAFGSKARNSTGGLIPSTSFTNNDRSKNFTYIRQSSVSAGSSLRGSQRSASYKDRNLRQSGSFKGVRTCGSFLYNSMNMIQEATPAGPAENTAEVSNGTEENISIRKNEECNNQEEDLEGKVVKAVSDLSHKKVDSVVPQIASQPKNLPNELMVTIKTVLWPLDIKGFAVVDSKGNIITQEFKSMDAIDTIRGLCNLQQECTTTFFLQTQGLMIFSVHVPVKRKVKYLVAFIAMMHEIFTTRQPALEEKLIDALATTYNEF